MLCGDLVHSESGAEQADDGLQCLLLLMRDRSIEWAWFNQCDVTLEYNLLAAQAVLVTLFIVHVTTATRSVPVSLTVLL